MVIPDRIPGKLRGKTTLLSFDKELEPKSDAASK